MRIALEINSMPFQNKIIIYLKRSDVFLSIRRRYFCDFILENNWDNFWKQKNMMVLNQIIRISLNLFLNDSRW